MNIIEISHLKKYYGAVKAVDDISFSVGKGEFFAFLGVNGAGKSTTISVVCGRTSADSGSVEVAGHEAGSGDEVKRSLGVVFQDSVLDRALSVRDNLACRAALYGVTGRAFERKFGELSDLFELKTIAKRPVGKLSGGQRRRVDIARALVHDPAVLILDEPTTGLDPQTRRGVWKTVHALRKSRELTVFLTTHYMEEAADADRVVIIDGGKILADDTPLGLKNRYTGDFITLYGDEERVREFGLKYEKVGNGVRIFVKDTAEAAALIVKYPELFTDFEVTKGGMDDVFLAVTGKRAEGGEQ